jgi:hypothetical protein
VPSAEEKKKKRSLKVITELKFEPRSGFLCQMTYEALQREICKDDDVAWLEKRSKCLNASTCSAVLKKHIFGSGGYTSASKLLRFYKDKSYREAEQAKLQQNPHIQRGRNFQHEAASMYSLLTGYTLSPLGFLQGPRSKSDEFEAVPDFIACTCDYIVLEKPILVEIKCPAKMYDNWREKHWVQVQQQMQLARIPLTHLVFYFPYEQCIVIHEVRISNKWFSEKALPCFENFWKLVKLD